MTSSASQPARRQLFRAGHTAGLTVAASSVLGPAPAIAAPSGQPSGIRPFRVAIPRERLAEMRRRVEATC
jgi:hypothetical protein